MLQKFSKILSLLVIILILSTFSVCYGTEIITTSQDASQSTSNITLEENFHYGDLYLSKSKVVIDNIVYGNVYIIANTVEITGQIEGNLFVLCNNLNIDNSVSNGGLVGGSIYACANNIYYNGACTYLYTIANKLDMTYDSFVIRDAKIAALNSDIRSGIGRDLDLQSINIKLGNETELPAIYGNLNYSSLKKLEVPEGIISPENPKENPEENITYTNLLSLNNYNIKDILIDISSSVIITLAVFLILNTFIKNYKEKIYNFDFSVLQLIKAFGIGLVSIIIIPLISILLLITSVGTILGIILAILFFVLYSISLPVLCIKIANVLKPILKLNKLPIFILVISLISIILYVLSLIPFVGIILYLIIKIISIGLVLYTFLPQRKLIAEVETEKTEIIKQNKEEKEKRKQEKFEAKVAKKQAKLEAKELNKKDNTDL